MNLPHPALPALDSLLAAALILLCMSCAPKPSALTTRRDTSNRHGFTMAGFELKYKGQTRQDVIARYGAPLSETTASISNEYQILTYPITGETGKLLLIFYRDDFLAATRETRDRNEFIERMIRAHSRVQDGKVVLFQAHYFPERKAVYFTAHRDQLAKVPKWKPGNAPPPPLSEAQAEAIASEWRQRNAPDLAGKSNVRGLHEVMSFPGVSFYKVDLGNVQAPPQLREVLVLMDGTVVAGESEPSE